MCILKQSIYLVIMIIPLCLLADPWGKDADLMKRRLPVITPPTKAHCLPLAEMLIAFHQKVISPADGPRSHFNPSSSQYTLDAMRKYGFFYGYILGCDRLMRENSEAWIYLTCRGDFGVTLKYDPVP